jgi:cytoskeletal protein CcmA (bactofilin family)
MAGQNETDGIGTVVGANVKLIGTIQDKNNILVHGSIDGEVTSDKSIDVAEGAKIKGPINGQSIKIAGFVQGSVTAKEKLEILSTGKVIGSVNTKDLVINSGATFVGKCAMPSDGVQIEDKEQAENSKTNKEEE